ncbi:MAG: hypothetical protein R3Y63_08940 [Eubacteriales bacterium]
MAKDNYFLESGNQGLNRWGGVIDEEFLRELRGAKGIATYREMADNDDMIGASLYAIEMLIRQVKWDVEAGGTEDKDEECREFVLSCMEDLDMPWTDFISEALSFLTYGWSWHEIVYKRRSPNSKHGKSKFSDHLIGWKKLPLRSQSTLHHWEFDETNDDLLGMWQSAPPYYKQVFIPKEKSLHFRTKSQKGNPEGRSILRNAYRSWFFKKRLQELEGIGIERDLAGLPVLITPEGLDLFAPENAGQKAVADRIVRTIKRDENEGLVLPYGWDLKLLSSGGSRQNDTNQVIERYDTKIASTMLTDFVQLGHEGVGSYALSSDKTALFSTALGSFMDMICQVMNTQAIPKLIDLNKEAFHNITDYPKLIHGDIETRNLEELGSFLKNAVGTGTITPDNALEEYLRREAGLPERDEESTYEMNGTATSGYTYQPPEEV